MGQVVSAIATAIVPIILSFFLKSPGRAADHIVNPTGAATKTKDQMIQEARANMGIDCVNNFNFAVCGTTGASKSSLVNGLRGINDFDPRAAKVGEVETTSTCVPYPHPQYPHIVFWDLPGAGTAAHSASDYFEKKCLYAFDCIIVVCRDRFMEIDLDIAYQASQWGVPVVFVRAKFDESYRSHKRRGEPGNAIDLQNKIVGDIRRQLQSKNLGHHSVYVLSAWRFTDDEIVPAADEIKFINDVLNLAASRRH